jgi:hypothetical protein
MLVSVVGVRPSYPNLTVRFAQDAKDAKKIFFVESGNCQSKRLNGSLRFDKTFDPAGSDMHPKYDKILCDLCVFAVKGFFHHSLLALQFPGRLIAVIF